ncbi:MAG TPA: hypothetical protein VMT71_17875 [Syntrophorhabdales bacterium]|nr:hypothetical protein [Syntrophorhabdales bacterium]
MQSVRKALFAGCVIALLFLASCASINSNKAYNDHMFQGKNDWRVKEYAQARSEFLKAYDDEKRVAPLAWAATTNYWMNDLPAADRYIREAEANPEFKKGYSWFRIMGYKSLVLIKQGNKSDGLVVLKTYIDSYSRIFPSSNSTRIAFMVRKGEVDLPRLEVMMEDDIWEYEQALEQFESGRTGYFDKTSGPSTGGSTTN